MAKCNQKRLQGVIKSDDKGVINTDAYKRHKNNNTKDSEIPEHLRTENFMKLWNGFIAMRKEISKPLNNYTTGVTLNRLSNYHPDDACDMLEYCILAKNPVPNEKPGFVAKKLSRFDEFGNDQSDLVL